MTKVTITRVFKGMKETKYGSKLSVGIQTKENGEGKWLSTFKTTPEMENWKEGDVVEINITENKGFLNFDTGLPTQASGQEERIQKLEKAVFGTLNKNEEKVVQIDNGSSVSKDDFTDF